MFYDLYEYFKDNAGGWILMIAFFTLCAVMNECEAKRGVSMKRSTIKSYAPKRLVLSKGRGK